MLICKPVAKSRTKTTTIKNNETKVRNILPSSHNTDITKFPKNNKTKSGRRNRIYTLNGGFVAYLRSKNLSQSGIKKRIKKTTVRERKRIRYNRGLASGIGYSNLYL